MEKSSPESLREHSSQITFVKEVEYLDLLITPWYEEYCSCFALCSAFGWDFQEKSKELLVAFASTKEKHGITTAELCEWVRLTDRDTIHGIVPLPDFSCIS